MSSTKYKHDKENATILRRRYPEIAAAISQIPQKRRLSITYTRKGEVNLIDTSGIKKKCYHSLYSPSAEAEKWAKSLEIVEHEVLYIYGIGLGYSYYALRSWLREKPSRYIVYIEDNPEVLDVFYKELMAGPILKDQQVVIYYLNKDLNFKAVLAELAWTFLGLKKKVLALPFYQQWNKDKTLKIFQALSTEYAINDTLKLEVEKYGLVYYRNFYANVRHLSQARELSKFFNSFNGIPAIIAGAGPSIEPLLPQLKSIQDQALLFAGGSTLAVLGACDIWPHFNLGVDPHVYSEERLRMSTAYEAPFIFRQRFNASALSLVNAPKLYQASNSIYPLEADLNRFLSLDPCPLLEGYSVVHFAIEVAQKMACSPIILVGVDLAYTHKNYYASGVFKGVDECEKTFVDFERPGVNLMRIKDIHGDETLTHWMWKQESEWIAAYARDHPQTKFINASNAGIGFEGVENLDLSQVLNKYCVRSRSLRERVHAELVDTEEIKFSERDLFNFFEEISLSLERVKGLAIRAINEKDFSNWKEHPLVYKPLESESSFQYIVYPLSVTLLQECKLQLLQSSEDPEASIQKVFIKLLNFWKEAAEVNLECLKNTLLC